MFPYLSFLSRAPFFETAHDSVGAGLIWLPWFVRFYSVYLVPSPTESRHSGLAGAGLGSLARASPGVPSHLIHGSDPRSSAVSWYVMVLTLTRSETWGGNGWHLDLSDGNCNEVSSQLIYDIGGNVEIC